MSTIAKRVMQRFVRAGLLEPPPAMHAAIMEWIAAVLAANQVKKSERQIESTNQMLAGQQSAADQLLGLAQSFADAPTWANYKLVYDQQWKIGLGHPGVRWSAKVFQKLTPEKKQELKQSAQALYDSIKEQWNGQRGYVLEQLEKEHQKLDQARQHSRADVSAMGSNNVIRPFPVDLSGWHMSAEFARKLRDKIESDRAQSGRLYDSLKDNPKAADMLEILKEHVEKGSYASITVELTTTVSDHYEATWNRAMRRITITVPEDAGPEKVVRLSRTLAHELRHFVQSYQAYVLGMEGTKSTHPRYPGMPSHRIRTPDISQRWSEPGQPMTPERTKEYQRVKNLRVDPKSIDWHALDDAEFYTRLADSVDEFVEQWGWRSTPPELLNDAIRRWCGIVGQTDQRLHRFSPHTFFTTLRKLAPGKWRKACQEFVKAVMKRL